MKPIKLIFAAVMAACLIACVSSSTFAASYGYATASLDYSSISLDLGSNVTTSVSYYAYADYGDASQQSATAAEALIEVNEDNWSWAEADVADDYEDIYAGVSVDSVATATTSEAIAEYGISFTATQAGTLTISINYELELDALSDVSSRIQNAYAEALVYLSINDTQYDSATVFFDAYNGMSVEDGDLGTLTYTYSYSAGDTVSLVLGAQAYADAVPVPGTGLLLGTSLMILAVFRRRRQ